MTLTSPLLSTVLALAGCVVGVVLHLCWHPLRQQLSDAWDFLRRRGALVFWVAGAALLAEAAGAGAGSQSLTLEQLSDWRLVVGPLTRQALDRVALLPHTLLAPWPLAVLMPFVFTILTVRIWRWPYRYGERRPGVEQKCGLLLMVVLGLVWLGLELAGLRRMLPEWVEMLKLTARMLFVALTTAGAQVWLICWVTAWERPPRTHTQAEQDGVLALERAFARWQGVAWLAGFDLLWLAWRAWLPGRAFEHDLVHGLWLEFLAVFVALPLAVATLRGTFLQQGAVALQVLLRALVPLFLWALTAVALQVPALYAVAMGRALSVATPLLVVFIRPLSALALAMLDSWLLLTALLVMLRVCFPSSTSSSVRE